MRYFMDSQREVVLPLYNQHNPNDPITILSDVAIEINSGQATGNAEIIFEFLPIPRAVMNVTIVTGFVNPMPGSLTINCPAIGLVSNAKLINCILRGGEDKPLEQRLKVSEFISQISYNNDHDDMVKYVIFHLPNMRNFICMDSDSSLDIAHSYEENGLVQSRLLGNAVMFAGGWRIQINALLNTNDIENKLQNTSGYALTHVGRIEREDGELFSNQLIPSIIEAISMYLSYIRGIWICPLLIVGCDENNNKIWESWDRGRLDLWRMVPTFFDVHNANMLWEVFPGFWKLWNDPEWKSVIKDAIYWYVTANMGSRGTDVGLIIAQCALELIGWHYFIALNNCKTVLEKTPEEYEKIKSGDKIRLFLDNIGIPTKMHSKLEKLQRLANRMNWRGGPRVIIEMRNDLVHSKKHIKRNFSNEINECWQLAQYYVELVLLRLFECKGKYRDRITGGWDGQVSDVPWI